MQEKRMICVLFNAGKKDELTEQCQERIRAGLAFNDSTLCFVGAKTWLMKTACPERPVIELDDCHNTVGNIREIKKFWKDKDFSEILIISNHYHLPRIRLLLKIFNLSAGAMFASEAATVEKTDPQYSAELQVSENVEGLGTETYWKWTDDHDA